jgi:HSP20 family protein
MAIARWNSFDRSPGVQEESSRFLRRNPAQPYGAGTRFAGGRWIPTVDIFERDGFLVVEIEIPGVDPEDIDVSIDAATLKIRAVREVEKEITEDSYYLVERATGVFQRSIRFPSEVDADRAKASYKNGLLTVDVPRAAPGNSRRVSIEIETGKEKQREK